jgi:hypothetical protein
VAAFTISGIWNGAKAVNTALKEFKKLDKGASFFAKNIKYAYATATVAATYYAKKLAVDSVHAALADAKSQRILAQTLKSTTNANDAQVIATEASISSLSRKFGIVDEKLRPALSSLALASKSAARASSDLALAIDISAARGVDLEVSTRAITAAYRGNFGALNKLGAGITKADIKAGNLDKTFGKVRTTFKGFAANEAMSLEGQFKQISVAADNAKEIIGVGILDAINEVIGKQGDINGLTKKFETIAYVIGDIIRSIGIAFTKLKQDPVFKFLVKVQTQIAKLGASIYNYAAAEGKAQRENLAILKSKSAQVISLRNAEYVASKKLKELNAPAPEDNRTELQRIADAMAAKAGFKVAEDLDSLNKIAAANRLAENRTYQFEYINSLQDQVAEFTKSEAAKVAIARKGIAEIETMLNTLGTKASNGFDMNFYMKIFGAGQGSSSAGSSTATIPSQLDPNRNQTQFGADTYLGGSLMSPGDIAYSGGSGQTVNNYNVSVNPQGSVLSEQDLQNAILEGIQRVQYYGANPILTNGGR